jgi:hypothetical protein
MKDQSPPLQKTEEDAEAQVTVVEDTAAESFRPDVADIVDPETEEDDLEEKSGNFLNRLTPGMFALIGLVLCCVIIGVIAMMNKPEPEIVASDDPELKLRANLEKENKAVKATLHAMEQAVVHYLSAESVEEILPYVRHADRVKPLMQDYYQTHSFQPAAFRQFKKIRALALENMAFVYVEVATANGTPQTLIVEHLPDDQFLIDWESDVCYLPIDWEKYLEEAPSKPMDMRVHVTADHYYAYEFRDESVYQCYKIRTRGSEEHLFGYAKKGTPTDTAIRNYISKSQQLGGGTNEPMILRLRFPEGSQSKRCVSIESAISTSWIYATSASAEKD